MGWLVHQSLQVRTRGPQGSYGGLGCGQGRREAKSRGRLQRRRVRHYLPFPPAHNRLQYKLLSTHLLLCLHRMTLEDTLETYSHFVKEADALGLAYICLSRYAAKMDSSFDGEPQVSRL